MVRLILLVAVAAAASAQTPTAGAYQPITPSERADYYWKSNFSSVGAATRPLVRAAFQQINDDPPEWDNNIEGFGRRTASMLAEVLIQRSSESLGAAALGQDPRYIAKREGGIWGRVGHALSSVVLTYDRNGDRVFAPARVGGFYVGSMARMTWMPDRYSWKDGFREGSQRLAFQGALNLVREFAPGIRDRLPGGKSKPRDRR